MQAKQPVLIYGAYGYTASLMLPEFRKRGIDFVVAGRNQLKLEELAQRYDCEARRFELESPPAIDRHLRGVSLVLNAAGPFIFTTEPLLDACLRMRLDYLDLSGELAPVAYAERCERYAKAQGVMLLPSVGFDVVPSDCLANYVAQKLPNAESLTLGIAPSNLLSRGSAKAMLEQAGSPARIRQDGHLVPLPFREHFRWLDFGNGSQYAVAVTWADLVSAYRSTGIPNIGVYFDAIPFRVGAVVGNHYWGWLARRPGPKALLGALSSLLPPDPGAERRSRESSVIMAEARRGTEVARARLLLPEAYTYSAQVAASVVCAILDGARRPGYQTPSQLLGPDFVLSTEGVVRQDLE